MKRILCLMSAVAVAGTLFAAEKTYTCSMKVGNPKIISKTEETASAGGGDFQEPTKMTRRKMTWPVTVSFRGKEYPTSGIKLNCVYFGMTDGQTTVLGRQPADVTLDEKGDFKIEMTSPDAVMPTTKARGGFARNGRPISGGSEVKGTRISGCVIQLLVGDAVVRSYASRPTWAKLARKNPLPEEDILKLR